MTAVVDAIVTDHLERFGRAGSPFESHEVLRRSLGASGHSAVLMGAATLASGPNDLIDHCLIEVDDSRVVDVSLPDGPTASLDLSARGPQPLGAAVFELIDSSKGLTLTRHVAGVPAPLCRFRRVKRTVDDLADTAATWRTANRGSAWTPVRAAVADDEPRIRSIVDAAYGPYVEAIGKPPAPMLDDYASLIADRRVEVAYSRGEIVGVLVSWPANEHLFIDNIAVTPAAHGHGVGGSLLDHASARAGASGLRELQLYTNVAMTQNLDYYPRRGFEETHRATDDGYERVYYRRPV